ncbi:hypothetical protein ACSQ6I_08240 [Anabaena sp. WFMT]|uniref:hypothetical protein n=1 Tax=Anabaena sp. WFMT TaxID=3449730 RepID=UPI003F25BA2F
MPKTLMIDVIMQQLDALSVEELLDVRAKVDALIHNKISSVYQNQSSLGFTPTAICYVGKAQPISTNSIGMPFKIEPVSSTQQENDNSLEKIIELVDEWMADESNYDQENYPQIEAALNQNRVSL